MSDQTATAQTATAQLLLNARRLRAGVLLTIIGGALGALGSFLAGVELAQATRKWLSESGYPPSDVARMKMHQAVHASRAASQAAVEAWQHNGHGAGAKLAEHTTHHAPS